MVYQQTRRWLDTGSFESIVHDLRMLLRLAARTNVDPTAFILDSRTQQSSIESGARAGYDGYKRKQGSKVHMAVDTLGCLLALHVSPANEQDRAHVGELCQAVQKATGKSASIVDQDYTGDNAAADAANEGIRLEVVKLPESKRGSVLLPRRWVVERSFGWASRFRRLVKDYKRLHTLLAGLHYVAFGLLMLQLQKAAPILAHKS